MERELVVAHFHHNDKGGGNNWGNKIGENLIEV